MPSLLTWVILQVAFLGSCIRAHGDGKSHIAYSTVVEIGGRTTSVPRAECAIEVEILRENGTVVERQAGISNLEDCAASAFSGWMIPVYNCELNDAWGFTSQANARHIVVLLSASMVRQCNRAVVSRHARDKSIRAVVEIVSGDYDIGGAEVASLDTFDGTTPWLVLDAMQTFAEQSTSEMQVWLWLDAHIARRPAGPSNSDSNDHVDSTMFYVSIGTICGALTGIILLLAMRLHVRYRGADERFVLPVNYDFGSGARGQTAIRTDVMRLLDTMPIGPYSKIRLLSKDKDQGHPVSDAAEAADDPCAVCLDDMSSASRCRPLLCGHIFHAACVDPWLVRHGTCPMCVMDVSMTGGFAPVAPVPIVPVEQMEQNNSQRTAWDGPTRVVQMPQAVNIVQNLEMDARQDERTRHEDALAVGIGGAVDERLD